MSLKKRLKIFEKFNIKIFNFCFLSQFNYTQLSAADLEKLGPCLYANMPTDYLKALDPSVFIKKFSTLGNVFQPTVSQITEITNLIS